MVNLKIILIISIVTIQCLRFDCAQHKKFVMSARLSHSDGHKMANLIILCIIKSTADYYFIRYFNFILMVLPWVYKAWMYSSFK